MRGARERFRKAMSAAINSEVLSAVRSRGVPCFAAAASKPSRLRFLEMITAAGFDAKKASTSSSYFSFSKLLIKLSSALPTI